MHSILSLHAPDCDFPTGRRRIVVHLATDFRHWHCLLCVIQEMLHHLCHDGADVLPFAAASTVNSRKPLLDTNTGVLLVNVLPRTEIDSDLTLRDTYNCPRRNDESMASARATCLCP